jgi:hypothetical protein
MDPDSHDDSAGIRRSRLALDAIVTLHAEGAADMQVRVIDASLSGLRLSRPLALGLANGQSLDMSLEARERRVQRLTGRVVRVGNDDFAVEFDRIDAAAEEELGWLIERFGTLME